MGSKPHGEAMAERFRNDPAHALEVIHGILANGDQAELMAVLRQLAQAVGGVCAQPLGEAARSRCIA